jgi:colicin import membrane protein
MTAPAITDRRRLHWHAPEKGTAPAFALSLFAHALLFFAIAFVVRWKTEPAGTISAELWSGFPAAAPAAAPAPTPTPVPAPIVEPTPPPPPPRVEPRPAPEPERKADIVVEQKKPEPPKKVEPPKEPPKKVEPPKPDPKKVEALKREAAKAEAAKVEAAKAEAAKAAAAKAEAAQAREAGKRREQELQRITAAAGGPAGSTGTGASATGVTSGGGMPRGYEGQVVGCIRPHIVFNVPDGVKPKQYVAEFEVQLLPTGEQATAPKVLKASGLPSFDQAVERAIRRCDPFPRPAEGAMPRNLRLAFDPVDTR